MSRQSRETRRRATRRNGHGAPREGSLVADTPARALIGYRTTISSEGPCWQEASSYSDPVDFAAARSTHRWKETWPFTPFLDAPMMETK